LRERKGRRSVQELETRREGKPRERTYLSVLEFFLESLDRKEERELGLGRREKVKTERELTFLSSSTIESSSLDE